MPQWHFQKKDEPLKVSVASGIRLRLSGEEISHRKSIMRKMFHHVLPCFTMISLSISDTLNGNVADQRDVHVLNMSFRKIRWNWSSLET